MELDTGILSPDFISQYKYYMKRLRQISFIIFWPKLLVAVQQDIDEFQECLPEEKGETERAGLPIILLAQRYCPDAFEDMKDKILSNEKYEEHEPNGIDV